MMLLACRRAMILFVLPPSGRRDATLATWWLCLLVSPAMQCQASYPGHPHITCTPSATNGLRARCTVPGAQELTVSLQFAALHGHCPCCTHSACRPLICSFTGEFIGRNACQLHIPLFTWRWHHFTSRSAPHPIPVSPARWHWSSPKVVSAAKLFRSPPARRTRTTSGRSAACSSARRRRPLQPDRWPRGQQHPTSARRQFEWPAKAGI